MRKTDKSAAIFVTCLHRRDLVMCPPECRYRVSSGFAGKNQLMADVTVDVREVAVDVLTPNPRQPRTVFDHTELAGLASTLATTGMLQPIVVAPGESGNTLIIVAGERRWRAAKMAGWEKVPVLVRAPMSDFDFHISALVENVSRVELNPLESAAAFEALLSDGLSHNEIADLVGCSRSHVSHTLSLLRLPTEVANRVASGVLSAGHAKLLVALADDPPRCAALASRIVAEGLSVMATNEILLLADHDDNADQGPRRRRRTPIDGDALALQSRLADVFDTSVAVTSSTGRGKIVVQYANREDLDRIAQLLFTIDNS